MQWLAGAHTRYKGRKFRCGWNHVFASRG
jgi:hypothetical protein